MGGYFRNGGSRVGHIGILRSWGHRNHCAGMLGHMTDYWAPMVFTHPWEKNMMFLLHQKWCLKTFKHKVLNHMFKFLSNHFWWGFYSKCSGDFLWWPKHTQHIETMTWHNGLQIDQFKKHEVYEWSYQLQVVIGTVRCIYIYAVRNVWGGGVDTRRLCTTWGETK